MTIYLTIRMFLFLTLEMQFLKNPLEIWAPCVIAVLWLFFVIYYDFVIGIESTAIETWGALTFHNYC